MPGALVIQTRSSLWYRQSRLKLESEETKSLAQNKGDDIQRVTGDLKNTVHTEKIHLIKSFTLQT